MAAPPRAVLAPARLVVAASGATLPLPAAAQAVSRGANAHVAVWQCLGLDCAPDCFPEAQPVAVPGDVTDPRGGDLVLRSGALEKRGLKFEEFAVPSGNLTMQQMVARQVDLGTYAGQSFVTGHDKGGLVAIAQIEKVGKTSRVMARKELKITKVADLKGLKIGNQVGSSIGNTFVDIIAPRAGLRKEDYHEVKMDVNEMVAAAAAKSIDAFISVDPPLLQAASSAATRPSCQWRGEVHLPQPCRPHLQRAGQVDVGPRRVVQPLPRAHVPAAAADFLRLVRRRGLAALVVSADASFTAGADRRLALDPATGAFRRRGLRAWFS